MEKEDIEKEEKKNVFSYLFNDYQSKNNKEEEEPALEKTKLKRVKSFKTFDKLIETNIDFSQTILTRLEEIKNNSLDRINELINNFKNSYENYKKNISDYLDNSKNNLFKVFDRPSNDQILYKYISKNIFNKIKNILEIYDSIFNNIEDNFELLNKYLSQREMIEKKNTLENFLNYYFEEITNSSIISKFNFEEIDPLNIFQKNYYKDYLNLLNKEKKQPSIKTFTIKKEENCGITDNISFIKDNYNRFKQLYLQGIDTSQLNSILDAFPDNQMKLKKIKIQDFDFSRNAMENNLIDNKLSKIEKLILKKGVYINPLFLAKLFLKNGECLTSLSLEKVNMTNFGWKVLLNTFYQNDKIRENLKYLSLSGNSISSINRDVQEIDDPNKNKKFTNLKIFNLSKNEMYKFDMELKKIPELKLLDLSSNNFPTASKMEFMRDNAKKMLVLFNDNIFISNSIDNNLAYIKYINKYLPNLDIDLKALNLRFTYDIDNQNNLENLKISPSIKISLIKLDLSLCGLSTTVIINFLKNNYGFFSLKNLKLKFNNIQSDIFKYLIEDNISLPNLTYIDLSQNEIPCSKPEENEFLIKFIQKFENLKRIKLKNCSYFENVISLISVDSLDNPNRKIYNELIDYLKERNRYFRIVLDNYNSLKIDEIFRNIFDNK